MPQNDEIIELLQKNGKMAVADYLKTHFRLFYSFWL